MILIYYTIICVFIHLPKNFVTLLLIAIIIIQTNKVFIKNLITCFLGNVCVLRNSHTRPTVCKFWERRLHQALINVFYKAFIKLVRVSLVMILQDIKRAFKKIKRNYFKARQNCNKSYTVISFKIVITSEFLAIISAYVVEFDESNNYFGRVSTFMWRVVMVV